MARIPVEITVTVKHDGQVHRWENTVLVPDDLLTAGGNLTREQDEAARAIPHRGFWEWFFETFGRKLETGK